MRKRVKSILALLIVAGGISSLTVSSTYALLSSEESNPGSTISSGTLTLGDTVNATPATICFSSGTGTTGNVNANCAAVVSTTTLQYPGGSVSGKVEIKDTGSVDGASLSLYMPTCTTTTSPGATGHTNGGNPCVEILTGTVPSGLELTIQETDSSWAATKCWYPVNAAGDCTTAAGYSTALPNSFGVFAEHETTPTSAFDLGVGPKLDHSRYFLLTVTLPSNASNTLQGEQANFDLTWRLTS